jgi:hypothetical protein
LLYFSNAYHLHPLRREGLEEMAEGKEVRYSFGYVDALGSRDGER